MARPEWVTYSDEEIEEMIGQLIGYSKKKRLSMQRKMLKNDLRNGRKNIAEIITKI